MRKRFHWLKKPKIRADWSKWTLYNISRATTPSTASKTFFQQKWHAKALTRAYHGEQVREKQWHRMFRRTLPAVVPMSSTYLANTDGSEMATGRGSGEEEIAIKKRTPEMTPYMHMTYAPIERRLDTAIWRALFASSARQARQFVVHGWVKVNGKKMIYPGYMLNPGDMFQVDPERVMWATGARKDEKRYTPHHLKEEHQSRPASQRAPKEERIPDEDEEFPDEAEADAEEEVGIEAETADAEKEVQAESKTANAEKEVEVEVETRTTDAEKEGEVEASTADAEKEGEGEAKTTDVKASTVLETEDAKKTLTDMLERTKAMLDDIDDLDAKRKQKLRSFARVLRKMLPRSKKVPVTVTDDLQAQLASLSQQIVKTAEPNKEADQKDITTDGFTKEQELLFEQALEKLRENPFDRTKPYLTPWRPRPYMSAFAFIPRYLEVNQNICAAVYLRHPVARPGLAEVPTPFNYETNQLAFNWYLRRR